MPLRLRTLLSGLLVALFALPAVSFVAVSSRSTVATPSRKRARASSVSMKVKGILFDMDGTLTDSDSLHYECYRDTLLRFAPEYNDGKPLDRVYYDAHMSGSSNDIIVSKLLPHWEHERMKELWLAKETLYRERSVSMKPLEGVLRILNWCDERDIPKIIVTNAPRIDAEHTLKTLGLWNRVVDVVIGEECKRPKPHPDPYLEGLERMGLAAEECIAFEDSFSGLASAQAAGLRTVGILTCRTAEDMLARGAFMAVKNFEADELWEFLHG